MGIDASSVSGTGFNFGNLNGKESLNLIQITPGAGGMYCGNCFRDNALVAALRRQGHETLMVPLYLPMTLDEAPTQQAGTPTFFGGINVFLSQIFGWHRKAPQWFRDWFDSPKLLKWAAGKAAKTRAQDVGALNLSMLRGEEGKQRRELEELLSWMKDLPRADAVFLSNALLSGFAREMRRQLGTRVICFLQSEESFLDSMVEPWKSQSWSTMAERSVDLDAWIAPSRYFADRMIHRLRLDPAKVHVVHNGINLAGYRESKHVRDIDPKRSLTLGFFARMCSDKGLDLVVDAYLQLRQRGKIPSLKLKIGGGCGPGDLAFVADQKRKLAAAGYLSDVSFHPNLTREEKVAFYSSCHVLSVPARMSEAFGLYVIEALAAGTPLVQPRRATYPELLDATGGGVLCESNTAESLAIALEQVLLDPSALRSMGERGRSVVSTRFTDDSMARQIAEITHRIVQSSPIAESRNR